MTEPEWVGGQRDRRAPTRESTSVAAGPVDPHAARLCVARFDKASRTNTLPPGVEIARHITQSHLILVLLAGVGGLCPACSPSSYPPKPRDYPPKPRDCVTSIAFSS